MKAGRLFHNIFAFTLLRIGGVAVLLMLLQACSSSANHDEEIDSTELIEAASDTATVKQTPDSAAIRAAIRAKLEAEDMDKRIIVDKPKMKLYVVQHGDTLLRTGICCGSQRGDKVEQEDRKTPEGEYRISMIQNSTKWLWDPKDGRPKVPNCYGPWFLRLDTRFHSIGIHGTGSPRSIGKRYSHGCIRVTNDNIVKLKEMVEVGTRVTIIPDPIAPVAPPKETAGEIAAGTLSDSLQNKEAAAAECEPSSPSDSLPAREAAPALPDSPNFPY